MSIEKINQTKPCIIMLWFSGLTQMVMKPLETRQTRPPPSAAAAAAAGTITRHDV